jgi:glycosyltransferase involved in cell wall biosynthesis
VGRPRVASLYEGFFSGGARILHTDVAVGLQERGYEQSVLAINNRTFRENTDQPMETDRSYQRLTAVGVVISSLKRRASGNVDYSPFTADELADAAEQLESADIIMSVKEQPLRLINQFEEQFNTPVLVGLHRSDPENQGPSLDHLRLAIEMGRVVGLVATAESAREAYVAQGVPDDMIHVIRNGIDLDRFRPLSSGDRTHIREGLAIDDNVPVVTLVARFDPMKDVPLFLRSARAYLEDNSTAAILMCGAGMTEGNPQLVELLREVFNGASDLRRSIQLLGIRADMESLYAMSDVTASTSLYGETFPLSLAEGLACHAVPVATNVGDTLAIVGGGRGILTTRNPRDIAEAWHDAYERRPEFLAAIAETRDQFGRENMIDQYSEIIDRYAPEGY